MNPVCTLCGAPMQRRGRVCGTCYRTSRNRRACCPVCGRKQPPRAGGPCSEPCKQAALAVERFRRVETRTPPPEAAPVGLAFSWRVAGRAVLEFRAEGPEALLPSPCEDAALWLESGEPRVLLDRLPVADAMERMADLLWRRCHDRG